MSRDQIFSYFFLFIFLWLLYQCAIILSPFATPILGAIVLTLIAYPVHELISHHFRRHNPSFKAAISTLVVSILIVAPFIMLCWLLFKESESLSHSAGAWFAAVRDFRRGEIPLSNPFFKKLQEKFYTLFGLGRLEFERIGLGMMGKVLSWISETGQEFAKNIIRAVISMAIMLFVVFFLFRDGKHYMERFGRLIPMKSKDKEQIAERLYRTLLGIMRGVFLTAAFQSVCAALGYLIVGIPSATILALLTGLVGFVPIVGTALIWVPVGSYYLLKGASGKGTFLLIWGLVVVTGLDHILRPVFMGHKSKLPVLFLFFGIFGGAEIYGVKGLLLGPLLMAAVPLFIEIYQEQYLRQSSHPPHNEP